MTTRPKPKVTLHNKSASNMCIELQSFIPRTAPRMRRSSPYQAVPINVPRQGSVNVAEVLSCSHEEASDVIAKTAFIQRLIRKGLLEVI